MRRIWLVVLLAVAAMSMGSTLWAAEWSRDYKVGQAPSLRVQTNDARIEVRAMPGDTIRARVTTKGYKIGPGEVTVQEHQNGDNVSLIVKIPSKQFMIGVYGVTVEITAPANTRLDLISQDGSLRLWGIHADSSLESGDGSIEVHDHQGKLRAKTSDGSVMAEGRFEDLMLRTADGRIDCEARDGSKISSGWSIETGDGSVTLRLPQTLSATIDMGTGDGKIHSDLALESQQLSESHLSGRLNGGGPMIRVRTGDGSIRLGRS